MNGHFDVLLDIQAPLALLSAEVFGGHTPSSDPYPKPDRWVLFPVVTAPELHSEQGSGRLSSGSSQRNAEQAVRGTGREAES